MLRVENSPIGRRPVNMFTTILVSLFIVVSLAQCGDRVFVCNKQDASEFKCNGKNFKESDWVKRACRDHAIKSRLYCETTFMLNADGSWVYNGDEIAILDDHEPLLCAWNSPYTYVRCDRSNCDIESKGSPDTLLRILKMCDWQNPWPHTYGMCNGKYIQCPIAYKRMISPDGTSYAWQKEPVPQGTPIEGSDIEEFNCIKANADIILGHCYGDDCDVDKDEAAQANKLEQKCSSVGWRRVGTCSSNGNVVLIPGNKEIIQCPMAYKRMSSLDGMSHSWTKVPVPQNISIEGSDTEEIKCINFTEEMIIGYCSGNDCDMSKYQDALAGNLASVCGWTDIFLAEERVSEIEIATKKYQFLKPPPVTYELTETESTIFLAVSISSLVIVAVLSVYIIWDTIA